MFIALPVGVVIDPDYGMLAKLKRDGFQVDAETNWRPEAFDLAVEEKTESTPSMASAG